MKTRYRFNWRTLSLWRIKQQPFPQTTATGGGTCNITMDRHETVTTGVCNAHNTLMTATCLFQIR